MYYLNIPLEQIIEISTLMVSQPYILIHTPILTFVRRREILFIYGVVDIII